MADQSILALLRKYEEAKDQNKSIYLDADEFDALAEYLDNIGDIEKARDVVQQALQIHPQSSSLLVKKAKFFVYDSDYVQALQILSSYATYDLDLYLLKIECYLNMDLYAEAFELTKSILDAEDSDLDDVFSQLGFVYMEADVYADAALYLEKSLDYDAGNVEVLTDLAYANEMIGEYEAAIKFTNKVLDIDSYNYDAWVNLGKLHSLCDEYDKAIDAFDFAIVVDGEDVNVLKIRGHCLSLAGRVNEAIKNFNRLLELTPDDYSIYFLLCECYQQLGLTDEAMSYIEKYAEAEGVRSVEYMAKKVQLLLLKEEYATASKLVDEAIVDEPESIELHIISSEIRLRQDLFDEAEQILLPLYQQNRDDFYLLNMLSIITIKKEEFDRAIRYTEMLLDTDSENIEIKQRLALLYFEVNNETEFNELLDEFTDKELMSLFKYIYTPRYGATFDRDQLVMYLNEARERRLLFKNIQY